MAFKGMVPTLLIGAGGIGGKIVSSINNSLTKEQKELVCPVCIDTNQFDLSVLADEGIKTVVTSTDKTVQEYLNANKEMLSWFPESPLIARKKMVEGAGQIRSVSRLAAEAAIKEGALIPLDEAIDQVKQMTGDPHLPDLKVIIVCSICGGTGAGLVVQLPYYIKARLDYVAGAKSIAFRGYFVGPSITEEKNTARQKAANFTNAYSCLKELNAIYKMQTDNSKASLLNIPYYDKVNKGKKPGDAIEVPYDFIFMFEKYNSDGLSSGGFKKQLENIKRTIIAQCFSVSTNDIYGSEDNYIIPRVESNGMNRYGGIALSKAIYPYDGILDYITNKWIADTIVKDWRAIDDDYIRELRVANVETHGKGVEEIGTLGDYYIEQVESDDIDSPYDEYYRQSIVKTQETVDDGGMESTIESEMSISEKLCTGIETAISLVIEDDIFRNNEPKVDKDLDVVENYSDISAKLHNIKKEMKGIIARSSRRIVESVIPLAYDNTVIKKEKTSLPDYLFNMHPIAARYLLYKFKKEIDLRYDEAEKSVGNPKNFSYELRNAVDTTDYYRKTEMREDPVKALEEIEDKLPDFLVKYSRDYKYIYNELITAAETEYTTNILYTIELIKKSVYLTLSTRLGMLIENYEALFKCIKKIASEAADEAQEFLVMHNANKGAEHYICASADNKTALYNEVTSNTEVNLSKIPLEAVLSLTQGLYDLMITRANEGNKKLVYDNISEDMTVLFNDTVIYSLTELIKKDAYPILDMNIIQAIKKQYWLSLPKHERPDMYEKVQYKDAKMTFKRIETKAAPYLKYTSDEAPEEKVCWIMNPSCFTKAERVEIIDDDGNAHKRKIYSFDDELADEVLKCDDVGSTEVFEDERVDKYTLSCLRSVYCLEATQLNLYKKGGRAYECYAERINKMLGIGSKQLSSQSDEGGISFVHPHIDKKWHIPSMLPALDPHEEEERQTEIVRAFILSLALRFCRITMDYSGGGASVNRWMFFNKTFDDKAFETILINKQPIGTEYKDLLEAFSYNSAMVYNVLNYAGEVTRRDVARCDKKEYSNLEQHQILFNLANTNIGTGDNDTENILISIFKLYAENGDDTKLKIVLKSLKKIVFDYSLEVTGNNKSEANIFYESVINACISSFNKTYKEMKDKKSKGKLKNTPYDDKAFMEKAEKRKEAFQQAYKTWL